MGYVEKLREQAATAAKAKAFDDMQTEGMARDIYAKGARDAEMARKAEVVNAQRSGAMLSPEAAGMVANDLQRGLSEQAAAEQIAKRQQEALLMDIQNRMQRGAPVAPEEAALYQQATQIVMPDVGPEGAPAFAGR